MLSLLGLLSENPFDRVGSADVDQREFNGYVSTHGPCLSGSRRHARGLCRSAARTQALRVRAGRATIAHRATVPRGAVLIARGGRSALAWSHVMVFVAWLRGACCSGSAGCLQHGMHGVGCTVRAARCMHVWRMVQGACRMNASQLTWIGDFGAG